MRVLNLFSFFLLAASAIGKTTMSTKKGKGRKDPKKKVSKKGTISPTRTATPTETPAPTWPGPTCASDLIIADGTVAIPEAWEVVPHFAFAHCAELQRVHLPRRIAKIGDFAFEHTALGSLTFETGSSLRKLGSFAFDSTPLSSIVIPAAVTKIGQYVFYNAKALASVTFEGGSWLDRIAKEAFYGTALTSINLPAGVRIGRDAFYGTPCPDKAVFQPGNTVVNCVVQFSWQDEKTAIL
mmetsp:Transcript_44051/g.86390  ORF Transcript_44051/g.86390 Transcript_44051/m.86390 type:complete len:239 (-) Transcript_44051:59-775(-)